MINFRKMEKSDMLMLRKPIIVFLITCAIVTAFYFVLEGFLQKAAVALSNAQAQYEQVSTSVQQIAQEEQTIIRYIDRYSQIEANGVVSKEDRLHLLESMTDIRSRFLLYPIEVDLSEQTITRLEGDPYALNPVGPVDLLSTQVSFVLPLLHEKDLTNFATKLLEDNGLLLPQHCLLNLINTEFKALDENLQADCTFLWYTFDVDAKEEIPIEY